MRVPSRVGARSELTCGAPVFVFRWLVAYPAAVRKKRGSGPFPEQCSNALAERLGAERTAEVAGARLRIGDGAIERGLHRVGGAAEAFVLAPLAEPGEQHGGRADQRGWIGAVLTGDVGRRPMLRLRHRVIGA